MNTQPDLIIQSRNSLVAGYKPARSNSQAAEGGCGVLGLAANVPIAGRHVLSASVQMHNRGNGKGGGIAMVGLDPRQAQVDASVLRSHYLIQVALLDAESRKNLESQFIFPNFDVSQTYALDHLDDYREVADLDVRPPDVVRYFVRVKEAILEDFAKRNNLSSLTRQAVEDEFVYQNSYRLNQKFYASLGEQRAFVLSHGKNLSVLKIVGYAEDVVSYYQLKDQVAHVWIAHQRYPTKGRVWHPGGAHPFIGLNEALVHNGDFANYHAVSEYLHQRNIGQLFLTDTEVSVQLFDLWDRVYGYPLEITLEAMAPTTEYDFKMLPAEKQKLYMATQRTHLHASPDGPWFFIVARSKSDETNAHFELLGITDTSMLRPQVFALYDNCTPDMEPGNGVQVGLIASERQAINACMRSLAAEDDRIQPLADKYWVARGGSHTDGGAFQFSVRTQKQSNGQNLTSLHCTNKFGDFIEICSDKKHVKRSEINLDRIDRDFKKSWRDTVFRAYDNGGVPTFWTWLKPKMHPITWEELLWGMQWLGQFGKTGSNEWIFVTETLDQIRDLPYHPGEKKRASLDAMVDRAQNEHFTDVPGIGDVGNGSLLTKIRRLDWHRRNSLQPPMEGQTILVIDTLGFPAEGDQSAARWLVKAAHLGWRWLIAHNWRGGRFAGSGVGENCKGLRIDLHGDVGDYAGSGLDGVELHIHGSGQDQIGQILKTGKLVIYGDAGQTFLYGAKGGEVYVKGSVAGRPLINAVGKPRAIINGTCLDYLAESFMAGNPHEGGGFVVINGVAHDDNGKLVELPTPYPGGNLLSLASGGAIYIRDPDSRVSADQLNGGVILPIDEADWDLFHVTLIENERLFDIKVEELLTVNGKPKPPYNVYRKIIPSDSELLKGD